MFGGLETLFIKTKTKTKRNQEDPFLALAVAADLLFNHPRCY